MTGAAKYQPYPVYKPSGVEWLGDIPEGWEAKRLKHTVQQARQITYGIVQAGPNVEVGIPYIRPADMTDEKGIRDFSSLLRTSRQIAANYERSTIEGGDLVCSIGPSFGKVMLVPDVLSGANLTQGTARIAVDAATSAKFIFWALRSPITFQQWESSVGGATFRALNLGPLAETYISIPPLPEQTKIAAFLDYETAKIDGLIAKQQRLIALLEEKRQAVIGHAVTKGLDPTAPLRPSGIDWLGDVPAHWEVKHGKHLFEFVTSGSRGWAEYYSDDGSLFFRIANLTRDTIRPKMQSVQCVLPPRGAEGERSKIAVGDLLISITADLGSICVADEQLEGGYVSQHVALCRPNDDVFSSDWLGYAVLADASKLQLLESGYGGTKVQLSLPDLRELFLVKPPKDEQLDIANFLHAKLERFAELLRRSAQQITLLKERRTALISAAVTGKIDLRGGQAPAQAADNIQDERALA